jgi:Tol biopolymer transport system component
VTSRRVAVAALSVALLSPAAAAAGPARDRTVTASTGEGGPDPAGDARHAAISASGRFVAFDADTTTLGDDGNGATRDVFVRDLGAGRTVLVSRADGGPAGDGDSTDPALSADGAAVAFLSAATNLAGTDANGADDVYVARGGTIVRASVALDGGDPDGASFAPDLSADGRYVAFASAATNLVDGDNNDAVDVFVRDLEAGTTTLASRAGRRSASGTSQAPALSPDGRYVSFASDAPDLVARDTNGVVDVFLADLDRGRMTRVSVSNDEVQQNGAVAKPFVPVSDVSRGGRYVVFDSDATNLVCPDRNRATDVFLRDVAGRTTRRISSTDARGQADNDSFWPTITPDGRRVGFESFAGNLSSADGPSENLFVYDRPLRRTTLVDVTASGGLRDEERQRQLLQRIALSADAHFAAFSSTARNLAPGNAAGTQDVFRRTLAAATPRIVLGVSKDGRRAYRLSAPPARAFTCLLDGRPLTCGPAGRLPRLKDGVHRLVVRAGGPGVLWSKPVARRLHG